MARFAPLCAAAGACYDGPTGRNSSWTSRPPAMQAALAAPNPNPSPNPSPNTSPNPNQVAQRINSISRGGTPRGGAADRGDIERRSREREASLERAAAREADHAVGQG